MGSLWEGLLFLASRKLLRTSRGAFPEMLVLAPNPPLLQSRGTSRMAPGTQPVTAAAEWAQTPAQGSRLGLRPCWLLPRPGPPSLALPRPAHRTTADPGSFPCCPGWGPGSLPWHSSPFSSFPHSPRGPPSPPQSPCSPPLWSPLPTRTSRRVPPPPRPPPPAQHHHHLAPALAPDWPCLDLASLSPFPTQWPKGSLKNRNLAIT